MRACLGVHSVTDFDDRYDDGGDDGQGGEETVLSFCVPEYLSS